VDAYGKGVAELTENEKQTVSALATLAAGLAGGLVGGDTASAVSGAQAGKVTVENNSLGLVIQGGKLAAQGCVEVAT
ncbi:VENN motif pre-toxin domain-containing protein, partial [Rosenbergiella australiborealis]